jgi:hypothetical protein
VVATIKAFCPDLDVAASRADLYAIHFDGSGLRRQAEALLAYDKVITGSGPGDPPPGSDRPLPAPPDDDDDDDIGWPQSAVPLPSRFDFGALSDVNAPATAAHRFVYWASAKEKFANLQALLHTEWPTKAKPLRRADYEILLQIDSPATSIEDFRSFDILLGDKPSVRVYTSDGAAYSFRFRDANAAKVKEDLNNCASIDLACAQSLPEPRARQRESPITQRKPSP